LNLRIALVVPGEYSELVGDLLKHLKKSEAWTKGRATVDDILRFVYTRQMDLWVIVDTDTRTVWGYLITEVKSYPAQKMLVLQYAAGHTGVLEQIEEQLHKLLENFAKDAGCAGIEFFGRPGWRNNARKNGYTSTTVVYEKYFGE
jgi:hypothetical protein